MAALKSILVGLIAVACALAAPEDYEGKTVVAIEFQPEQQPYPIPDILAMLPVKTGRPLRLADVRSAIDVLNATGRYADIDVDAEFRGAGVAIRFLTHPNFFVGRVTVDGVPEPPNRGVLVNSTRLELGRKYSDEHGKQAIENLRQVLKSNGLFLSRIEPEFEHDPATQQVNIRFVVTPGPRAKYTWPKVTGDPEQSAEDIADLTHWKRIWFLGWRPVSEARTQSGLSRIRRWYQKRDRLMAQVQMTDMAYERDTNRAIATIDVEAGPKVRIVTAGTKVSKGKLRQLIPVYEEQSADRDLLVEGARNLTEYFESKGYFHTKVDFTTTVKSATPGGSTGNDAAGDASSANQVEEIVYMIDKGERHSVVAVNIHGNKYFDTSTIKERMYVRPASFIQFRHGRYSDDLLRRDISAIEDLYQSNGFRDVQVAARTEHGYGGKHTNMAIDIQIREGPQWLVAQLQIEGASKEHEEYIRGIVQSTEGQPFSESNVSVDRDNILDYYYNNGYPQANFQYSFVPAKEPNQVVLKYVIQEGNQRFVRDVLITGLKTTDPDLVHERITFAPGDPLSRTRVLDTQRRLYDLGIFAKVDMALQDPEGTEQKKYVLLQAEESRRYTVTGGIGAEIAKIGGSTTVPTDPAGKAGFSPRVYFDITRRNMFGEGHIASFRSRVSNLQQRGVLSYQAPQFRGNPDVNLTFSGTYDLSRNVRTFTSLRKEVAVQVGQRLSKANTALYRLAYRQVKVTDLVIPDLQLLFPQVANSVRLGIIGGSFIQDKRDDPTNATKGIYSTADASWATRYLGAQANFTNLTVRNATYHPFGLGRRYVFARSLTLGWIQNLRSGQDVPLPEHLFAGGANSHRGFPENQAGPRDPATGFPLGGKAMLLNQFEWRFPLLGENIGGVLFHDAGNVYAELNKVSLRWHQKSLSDFNYMVHAFGFGIRYRTPVGPLRLDLAYAPNTPKFFGLKGTTEELIQGKGTPQMQRISRFQFHFSLGQAF